MHEIIFTFLIDYELTQITIRLHHNTFTLPNDRLFAHTHSSLCYIRRYFSKRNEMHNTQTAREWATYNPQTLL